MRLWRKAAAVMAVVCGLLSMAQNASAGITFFSRANCVNNESISWDWPGNNYWLWTFGYHYDNKFELWEQILSTGWEETYRSAAIHWGEGFRGQYTVFGDHYMWVNGYGLLYMGRTQTNNCNLAYFFPYW